MELIRNRGEGRRLKRVIALAAAATAVALIVTGCAAGTPSSTSGSGSKGATITFIPKNLNNPYTGVELKGGKEASATLGFTYNAVGALDASADSQVPFIQTEVQNGTKVIAIAANDPNAVCSSLNQAKAGGAKIITFDSDTDKSCRSLFINQVNTQSVADGRDQADGEQINDEGQIAILSATANATNQNAWIADMKKDLATNPEVLEDPAGDDGLRQRRRHDVVPGGPGSAAVVPEPEGDHLAHHGRYRCYGSLPVDLVVQGQGRTDRSRPAEPDAPVREGRHRQGVRSVGPGKDRPGSGLRGQGSP
jgi:hypothetical protein